MTTQAMAAEPESSALSTIDLTTCVRYGRYHGCILKVDPSSAALSSSHILLSNEQFEALQKLPALTDKDTNEAKKVIEATPPNSTK
jgi:hypothetical protein